jgi:hypothetical protein
MGKKSADAAAVNLTTEEIKTRRIADLAAKKKKALEDLAEAEQMGEELGLSSPTEILEEPQNGHAGESQDRLSAIIEAIEKDSGYWEAYREINGQRSKLGRFSLSEYPEHLDALANAIGGGKIVVQFKRGNGTFAAQQTFSFDPATYHSGTATGSSSSPSSSSQPGLDKFLEVLAARDQSHKEEISQMRREMFELQKTMLLAAQNNDPLKSIAAIKEIGKAFQHDAPKPLDVLRDVVETLSFFREGGVEPPSPMEALFNKALDMLGPVVKVGVGKFLGEGASPKPGSPAGAQSNFPSANPIPALAGPSEEPVVVEKIPADLATLGAGLLDMIRKGSSPETAASAVRDYMTPETAREFKPLVQDPDIADKIMKQTPALHADKAWLVQFALLMREEIEEVLGVVEEAAAADSPQEAS